MSTAKKSVSDSLTTVLGKYEQLFTEINLNEVETIMQTIEHDVDSAASFCEEKKIKISQEDATFFGRYHALRSGLKKFGNSYNNIKEELAMSKKQLAALKVAAEGGKFDEAAIKKYESDEAVAVKNLTEAIDQLYYLTVTVRDNYKKYRPQFLAKLDALSKK